MSDQAGSGLRIEIDLGIKVEFLAAVLAPPAIRDNPANLMWLDE